MIDQLKPYPEYKGSGIEWLGEVPAHWEVVRDVARKRCCRADSRPPRGAWNDCTMLLPVFRKGQCTGYTKR